jgi:hypothetical protein
LYPYCQCRACTVSPWNVYEYWTVCGCCIGCVGGISPAQWNITKARAAFRGGMRPRKKSCAVMPFIGLLAVVAVGCKCIEFIFGSTSVSGRNIS